MHRRYFYAFSIIELAFLVLIIAVLIAGVISANIMISKFRILSAQSLTTSSPVNGISGGALWLESSLNTSFKDNEKEDSVAITAWYDSNNTNLSKAVIQAVGSGPIYSNSINGIHAVKFLGSSSNYLRIANASFLNKTDYTIFVLEKRQGSAADNYFIGSPSSNSNDALALGYYLESAVIHAQGSNSYQSSIDNYIKNIDKPRIFTFVSDSVGQLGKKTYINGTLVGASSNNSQLFGITTLDIGKNYTGEIGEIIIFTRALKSEERTSIENYLGKKWNKEITRDSVSSCTNGIYTESGCVVTDQCSFQSVNGITNGTLVSVGTSDISCSGNYTGTLNYTCNSGGGIAINTGSCSCITGYFGSGCSSCDTANNYQSVSGTCQKTCPVPSGSGTTATYVTVGSTSAVCDSTGYKNNMIYTCNSSGILNVTTPCTAIPSCTGGDVTDTTTVPGTTIHKFTTVGSSNFTCTTGGSINYLIVAGGGGGGPRYGGGGGAGGLLTGSMTITNTTYTVVVGDGGNGTSTTATVGLNGYQSKFGSSLTASGGGGGGSSGGWWNTTSKGNDGGSGGGSSGNRMNNNTISGGVPGGSGTAGQGNNGAANVNVGGGGGGAGAAAANNSSVGGAGISSSISGVTTYYAGGGAGGTNVTASAAGGSGGGGSGGSSANVCSVAQSNTGGSGGGGGLSGSIIYGCKGGSGIVIISY